MRYWLSVGAIPSQRVQRLLEKFDFVPKTPRPFGSQHDYQKPEREYKMQHFRGLGKSGVIENKVKFHYKQKLQEEMNIVERRRRLSGEALQNAHAAITPFESNVDQDTDGQESDEPDIFERKDKFEKLLRKFEDHRRQKGLQLRGNDLRSNIWLKKMQKLARGGLGLDLLGQKDYINNLKEFASSNSDDAFFALQSLTSEVPSDQRSLMAL